MAKGVEKPQVEQSCLTNPSSLCRLVLPSSQRIVESQNILSGKGSKTIIKETVVYMVKSYLCRTRQFRNVCWRLPVPYYVVKRVQKRKPDDLEHCSLVLPPNPCKCQGGFLGAMTCGFCPNKRPTLYFQLKILISLLIRNQG